jgi:putative phosphoesterase
LILRIAVISDIHANPTALTAAMNDMAASAIDTVVCLGDIATLGPCPNQAVAMLQGLDCPTIVGNHDQYLFDPDAVKTHSTDPLIQASVDWSRNRLSTDHLAFLRRHLTPPFSMDADGTTISFSHGSPRSNTDNLLCDTAPEALDAMLAGTKADLFVAGHTHIQMLRRHKGVLIINPGSVGLPFQEYVHGGPPQVLSHAEYGIIDIRAGRVGVDLKRIPLNRDELRQAAAASTNPICRYLETMYQPPNEPTSRPETSA